MPLWHHARVAIVSEKLSLGSGRTRSRLPTGSHMWTFRLAGRLMRIETATQPVDESQVLPGPRLARHVGGEVLQVILGMCTS